MCTILHVQVAHPTETDEQAEARARARYRYLTEDARGREVVRDILRWCRTETAGPIGGEAEMAADLALKALGLMLVQTIRKHDSEGWVRIEAEHTQEIVLAARIAAAADEATGSKQ